MQETLFSTISIVDRFLAVEGLTITRSKLQLVGVAAMFLASKVEEVYAPACSDFVYITDNAYTEDAIKQMEMKELLMWKTTNMQVDLATKKYRLEHAHRRKYQCWGQRDVTMDLVDDIPDTTETKESRIERAKLKTIQWWASRDVTMEMEVAGELSDTPMTTPTTKPDEMFASMLRKRNRINL